ncbi:MAG: hypothetical protein GC204_12775 [Chloroflexi bacterium]|nr:hypothetical protein [Chloroflexota bacterium]
MRLRIFLMLLGAVLVVATFTFPLWQPIVENRGPVAAEAFPGLDPRLQSDFVRFPQEQQRAFLALAQTDPDKALAMVTAALSPRILVPTDQQAMPELNAPVTVASGTFQQINAIQYGQGTVNIFQDATNALTMRFDGFSVMNGPDLHIYLTAADAPKTSADMTVNGVDKLDVGTLQSSYGGQNYPLVSIDDLSQYHSVVIYSPSLDLIYTYAPLFVRQ